MTLARGGLMLLRVFSQNKKVEKKLGSHSGNLYCCPSADIGGRNGLPFGGYEDICASCYFRSSAESLLVLETFVLSSLLPSCHFKKSPLISVFEYCLFKMSGEGK